MSLRREYSIKLVRHFKFSSQRVFSAFRDLSFFKLTGADSIQGDLKTGREFVLTFHDRGKIYGNFIEVVSDKKVVLDWNVEGFGRQPELHTLLTVSLI